MSDRAARLKDACGIASVLFIASLERLRNLVAYTPDASAESRCHNVLVITDDGTRELVQMRWGLIPSWAEDPAIGNHMINARAETIVGKPSFNDSLKKRR